MGKRKSPEKGWALDKSGKWRDERGKFLSRDRLRDGLAMSSPEQVAAMLERSAKRQGRGTKQRFIIHASFDGVGWRSIGFSQKGLKVSLRQGADWLRHELDLRIKGEYRKLDKVNKKKLRRGEHIEPRITDIRIVKLMPSKMERKAAAKKRKRK